MAKKEEKSATPRVEEAGPETAAAVDGAKPSNSEPAAAAVAPAAAISPAISAPTPAAPAVPAPSPAPPTTIFELIKATVESLKSAKSEAEAESILTAAFDSAAGITKGDQAKIASAEAKIERACVVLKNIGQFQAGATVTRADIAKAHPGADVEDWIKIKAIKPVE